MRPVSVPDLVEGVCRGSRQHVARAITLVESARADHRAQAGELLAAIADRTGRAVRVGVSGVPGAGKSTFIDALGLRQHPTGEGTQWNRPGAVGAGNTACGHARGRRIPPAPRRQLG